MGQADLKDLKGYTSWLSGELEDLTEATFVETETQRMLKHVTNRSKHVTTYITNIITKYL